MFIEVEASPSVQRLRCEPRMQVCLSGQLHSPRGVTGCRIHDISRGGAAIEADLTQEVGDSVTVQREGFSVSGTVAWSRGRRFGISFDKPIRATEIFVQMSQSRKARPAGSPIPRPLPVSACASARSPSR